MKYDFPHIGENKCLTFAPILENAHSGLIIVATGKQFITLNIHQQDSKVICAVLQIQMALLPKMF